MRLFALPLLLALASPGLPAAEPPAPAAHAGAHQHHRFDDPERWTKAWDDPGRAAWQKAAVVLRVLGVVEGMVTADLGAGTGYFTRVLSLAVGETGEVYAVDIEPSMLEHIRRRDDLDPSGNVVTVLADPDDPKLPAGALDLILTVNTWHHIEGRVGYLAKLAAALKSPGGRVAVIDWRKGDLPLGPPDADKLSRDEVVDEFRRAGWQLTTESRALPYQYLLIFARPGADSQHFRLRATAPHE